MVTPLTTSAPHVTASGSISARARWERLFPFRTVVLPWLVTRLVVAPVLILTAPAGSRVPGRLIWMDGLWFRNIAIDWYDLPYAPPYTSEFPFFPLLPALGGILMNLGAPPTLALAGISWLAALVAMAGIYRLALRHLPERAVAWAPWFVAVAPGAVTLVLGYADSLYLAGLVWGLVLADERRWLAAGLAAAVATAARPNGWIAPVALLVTVLVARAGWRAAAKVTVPSILFLIGWLTWLEVMAGDAFIFWTTKEAWDEITIGELLADPFRYRHWPAVFHLLCFVALAIPYALRARRQPVSWAVVVVLGVLPPLLLGVEGLARYAIMAFPMPLAAADVLTSRGPRPAVAALAVSGAAMIGLAVMINQRTWVP